MFAARQSLYAAIAVCAACASGCGGDRDPRAATLRVTSQHAPFGDPTDVYVNGTKMGNLYPNGTTAVFEFIPKEGLNTIGLRASWGRKWDHTFLINAGEEYSLCFISRFGITIVSRSDADRPPAEEVLRNAERSMFESRMVAVTKEHAPELQDAIERIEREWKDREGQCERLAAELNKLTRDPASDGDLRRWRAAIEEMKAHLTDLCTRREEAYLAFKKFDLAPSGKEEYDRMLRAAKAAAADSEAYHKKMQARLESK